MNDKRKGLFDLARHPGTPIEEARTAAMQFVRMLRDSDERMTESVQQQDRERLQQLTLRNEMLSMAIEAFRLEERRLRVRLSEVIEERDELWRSRNRKKPMRAAPVVSNRVDYDARTVTLKIESMPLDDVVWDEAARPSDVDDARREWSGAVDQNVFSFINAIRNRKL